MKLLKIAFAVASLALASAAVAGEDVKMKIQIAVDDDSDGSALHFNLDSDSLGFDLHGMQEGEVQSVVDESGRSILITREADGFKIDVDGKTIDLPLFAGKHQAMWVGRDFGSDVDINITGNADFTSHKPSAGVTIISGKAIDDVTRETIKSLLMSTGQEGEIKFISGGAIEGIHKTVIMKREVVSPQ